MKKITQIIQSDSSPKSKNVIWAKDGNLYIMYKGKWHCATGSGATDIAALKARLSVVENKKANKGTTLLNYGITDAYTKNETYTKSEIDTLITTVYTYQGSVQTFNLLPATAEIGDVYNILEGDYAGYSVSFDGEKWNTFGPTINLEPYALKKDMTDKFTLIDKAIDDLASATIKIKEVTYDELVALKSTNSLIPGQFYRMTDYVTMTLNDTSVINNPDYYSKQYPFDLVLQAISYNTLDENVRAINHENATYQFENIEKWELKYSLENEPYYTWCNQINGKGVIYYMKDNLNNEAYYDFKNIVYKVVKPLDPLREYYVIPGSLPESQVSATDIKYYFTFGAEFDNTIGTNMVYGNKIIRSTDSSALYYNLPYINCQSLFTHENTFFVSTFLTATQAFYNCDIKNCKRNVFNSNGISDFIQCEDNTISNCYNSYLKNVKFITNFGNFTNCKIQNVIRYSLLPNTFIQNSTIENCDNLIITTTCTTSSYAPLDKVWIHDFKSTSTTQPTMLSINPDSSPNVPYYAMEYVSASKKTFNK